MQMAMVLTPQKPIQRQRFFGELPEGLPGSTLERGMRGEKRQELGRPCGFQLAGKLWQGIRIVSPALGKPSTHGRPDPKPPGAAQVGRPTQPQGARPMTLRESDPLIVLGERESRSQGEGADS